MINKKEQGKKNRISGQKFELFVRKNLEESGWIVIKNPNNVIDGKFTQGKAKYNPFTKRLMMNSGGFPDFICFRTDHDSIIMMGVECKVRGYLDKEEKEKCDWLIKHNIFDGIWIAKKIKINNRIKTQYKKYR